jgi:hypothetical protein
VARLAAQAALMRIDLRAWKMLSQIGKERRDGFRYFTLLTDYTSSGWCMSSGNALDGSWVHRIPHA